MSDTPSARHRHPHVGTRANWLTGARIVAKVVAALLSATLMVGFGYGWKNYRDLDGGLQRFTLPSLNQPRQVVVSGTTQSPEPTVNGQDQNILIAGADDRSDMTAQEIKLLHVGHDSSLSTDVIMVVHVPADGSKATLLSIPRDTYVDIPGFRKNKINAAYADGYSYATGSEKAKQAAGFDKLVQTVTDLTGLRITHYVQVGFIGFYRIAQAIGGITVDLCKSVSDQRYSGFVQSAGVDRLNPVQSLQFVRQRHNLIGGDLGRAKRQRYFIAAAFRKIASAHVLLNPNRLSNLVHALTRSFYVDSTFKITDFAAQMSDLSANNIVGRTIPTTGQGSTDVGDVIFVNPTAVRKFAANLVYKTNRSAVPKPSTSAASRPAPSPSTTSKPIDAGCVN